MRKDIKGEFITATLKDGTTIGRVIKVEKWKVGCDFLIFHHDDKTHTVVATSQIIKIKNY